MSLRISVITAVFNGARTIAEAVESVRDQLQADVEHVVMDAGSTDGTIEILESYRSSIAHLSSEPDKGIYDGLNKGIRRATGDVIGFMHSDDMFASRSALQRVARAFEDPAVDAVYGDLLYVHRSDPSRVIRYWKAGGYQRARLLHGWMPPHPTFYVRRGVYERFGDFDTRFRISADYENMLRILWGGHANAAYIPEVQVRMRAGGVSNRSLLNLVKKSCEDFVALRQNGISPTHALMLKNMSKLPQFLTRPQRAHLSDAQGGASPMG